MAKARHNLIEEFYLCQGIRLDTPLQKIPAILKGVYENDYKRWDCDGADSVLALSLAVMKGQAERCFYRFADKLSDSLATLDLDDEPLMALKAPIDYLLNPDVNPQRVTNLNFKPLRFQAEIRAKDRRYSRMAPAVFENFVVVSDDDRNVWLEYKVRLEIDGLPKKCTQVLAASFEYDFLLDTRQTIGHGLCQEELDDHISEMDERFEIVIPKAAILQYTTLSIAGLLYLETPIVKNERGKSTDLSRVKNPAKRRKRAKRPDFELNDYWAIDFKYHDYNYQTLNWMVRGHFRHYDDRTVWIKPHLKKRRADLIAKKDRKNDTNTRCHNSDSKRRAAGFDDYHDSPIP